VTRARDGCKKEKSAGAHVCRLPDDAPQTGAGADRSGREGGISLDPTGKAAGRGAYLCRDTACLAKAVKEKRLERALKSRIPTETVTMLERMLTEGKAGG
jgi:hypothetical protein